MLSSFMLWGGKMSYLKKINMSGFELYRMVKKKEKPTLPYLQKYFFFHLLCSLRKKFL